MNTFKGLLLLLVIGTLGFGVMLALLPQVHTALYGPFGVLAGVATLFVWFWSMDKLGVDS